MTVFDWPLQKNTIGWKERLALAKFILTSDRFTNGPECRQFEDEWSEWQGAPYSLYVANGSVANFLLLDAVHEQLLPRQETADHLCTRHQLGHKHLNLLSTASQCLLL